MIPIESNRQRLPGCRRKFVDGVIGGGRDATSSLSSSGESSIAVSFPVSHAANFWASSQETFTTGQVSSGVTACPW